MATNKFARVDAENNVFVIDNGTERKVGQYPNVTPEDALAYYERKFAEIESHVRLLEQRVAAKIDVHSLKKALQKLHADLVEPAAVGDLADLRNRAAALDPKVQQLDAERSEQTKEQVAEALAARLAIAEKAEAIAAQDAAKIQWKTSSAQLVELFEQWQALQKTGAKVSKADADPIWKRFSTARTKFDTAKRHHFAALDANTKQVKAKKVAIVEAAEQLAAKGSDGVTEYRKLLDQWKAAGRANAKVDDELWARFKAAGDKIYAAKAEVVAVENVAYTENLKTKLALLEEANKTIDPSKDLAAAKKALQVIQAKWEKAGKVPKDKVREVEDKLRAIEAKVRKAEEEHWRKTDPATVDRTNSVLSQLEDSIAKLENDLKTAKASKDAKKIATATAALDARKAWLEVVKASAK